MALTERLAGMARAELMFGNWGGETPASSISTRRLIEFGKTLKVKLGDDALFEGRISAITADYPDGAPPTVGLLAEDKLQDLRMTRRTRMVERTSLTDLASTIASDHGLTPRVDLPATNQLYVAQLNQSDLAIAVRPCAARGRHGLGRGQRVARVAAAIGAARRAALGRHAARIPCRGPILRVSAPRSSLPAGASPTRH